MASFLRNVCIVTIKHKKQMCVLAVLTWCMCGVTFQSSLANSYLEMITTPPAQNTNSQPMIYADEVYIVQQPTYVQAEPQEMNMQYSKISGAPITSSPVVTSSYPKYVAWKNAQNNNCCYVHDGVQNLIYFIGGAVAGRIAYDIWGPHHRHHLLDHW